jgi:hypothetical protein
MRVDKITIPTLTKFMEISNNAINSLGFAIKDKTRFDVLEFSRFNCSFSSGLMEKNADSELVVKAASTNKRKINTK